MEEFLYYIMDILFWKNVNLKTSFDNHFQNTFFISFKPFSYVSMEIYASFSFEL